MENCEMILDWYLVDKALHDGECGDEGSMNWKEDVVEFNWVCTTRKSQEIFFLEERHKVKTDIEDSVEGVSHKVQRQKIKA